MWGASNKASEPAGRSPQGRGGGRASASLPLLDDVRHRLRRGASHLPARRSRQNVNLFLREPLARVRHLQSSILYLRSLCLLWLKINDDGTAALDLPQPVAAPVSG